MQNQSHTEKLLAVFAGDYRENVFYFCLKKTGNPAEAEELAAEISIEIVKALRKGIVPAQFSAWVWQIARNRYSHWAANLYTQRSRQVAEAEAVDDLSAEEAFLQSEELALLRREMAFTAAEYREIVTAYYIDGRKIEDLAKILSLPAGTVKSRLFHARKKLKEGMEMAREFGKRSYQPEDVNFAASGNQPSGLPWRAVQRKIPKNILLHAHNNPSTLEELSIELGIAMAYMEEEVKLLVDSTLLAAQNGRFITNFFIADKECQLAVYNALRKDSKERSRKVNQIVDETRHEVEKLPLNRGNLPFDQLKWLLVTRLTDNLLEKNAPNIMQMFQRPDGGNWGFMGMEQHDLIAEDTRISHDGIGAGTGTGGDGLYNFITYSYPVHNLWRKNQINYTAAQFLGDLVKNNRTLASITTAEKNLWEQLAGRFAHADEQGNILPQIAVFTKESREAMFKIFAAHPAYDQISVQIDALRVETTAILKQRSNKILHNHMAYYTEMLLFQIRMMAIHDLLAMEKLAPPADGQKSNIGMYLEI